MPTSIRDWQKHGVTLKVELATSGSLIVGSNETKIPFNTGGSYGAPVGWRTGELNTADYEPYPGSESMHNHTTSGGLYSTSSKGVALTSRWGGIWSNPTWVWPVTPGHRYQVGAQVRQMAGKALTVRRILVQVAASPAGPWVHYINPSLVWLGTEWEDVSYTGPAMPAGMTVARILLLGANPPAATLTEWGLQWQNLYLREMDLETPPLTWVDITCDVQAMNVRYGRERFTNRYDVSTMQLDMLNTSGKYTYHENHPLNLAPGRQVRVTATYEGIEYPLAFHVIDSLTDGYSMDGHVVSRWSLTDPTAILSNKTVASSQLPPGSQKGGGRINAVLDQIGYLPRLIDEGNFFMRNIEASGRSLRDEAGVTADSEGGNFFADREGNCVYKDRDWNAEDSNLNTVTADLVGQPHWGDMPQVDEIPTDPDAPLICINELQTSWSLDRVVNIVSLANAGGTAQEYVNEASMKQYGPFTYQRHDFVNSTSGYILDQRAADIMTGYSDPVLRVNSVAYAPGVSGAWDWTLAAFLNWMVRVWYSHPTEDWGYAVCVHIQSIEHRISPKDWLTTLVVDLPASFRELEWSDHGWDMDEWDATYWDQTDVEDYAKWSSDYYWSDPLSLWGPRQGVPV